MKKYILLAGFTVLSFGLKAQTNLPKVDTNTVYTAVEVEPQPIGGLEKFYDSILKNIRSPQGSDSTEIFHRIILRFIVERDGTLTHFAFLRNTVPSVQKEILRVMKLAPRWSAGKQNGQPVRVQFTIPFQFEP